MRKPYFRFLFPLVFLILLIHTTHADSPTQWLPRGPGGGGALFAPSFSPHNPNELYIACDMSELFHTTNLGAGWQVVDFRQIQGNRQAVVRFTSDPAILYSIDNSGDLATPTKSTDGGATWHHLTNEPTGGEAYALFADGAVTNRLIVSDYSHLYFSSDGGATFTQKFSTASGNGCFIGGVFFDGANIYVGTNLGLLVSTNNGSSFALSSVTGIPSTQAIVSFAGAKQNNTTRFFCVTLDTDAVYPGLFSEEAFFEYAGVYSLDVGQASWTLKTSGIAATDMPLWVSMARNDISTAYIAGQSDNEFPFVYKTTSGGGNWQGVLLTTNNQNIFTGWAGRQGDRDWSYGAGALGFAVAPNDADKVAFTDLGFAHITTDGGVSWRQMYVDPADQNPMGFPTPKNRAYRSVGLEDTSCWWLTWVDANNIFASYSDIKSTRSTDAGLSWSFNFTGQPYNSTYQSVKHANGNLYVGTSSAHDIYQSTYLTDARLDGASGEILYSTNGGAAWQTLHNFNDAVVGLALDPNNANRMYASVINSTAGGIFVSSNIQNTSASTWTKLANPPRTEGHPFNIFVLNDGTLVCTYSGRRNSSGTFTASSGVFVSTNGGSSWTDRSHSGMQYWTKDIRIDPHDINQNTWYVGVYSGWGGPPNGLGGLYKTTDRGVNWTRINNLDRVGSCTISPTNPNEMYLTTEVNGLWYSNNINAATPTFTPVLSYPFRQPERVFFNPHNQNEVWVTSFGHGLRVGTIPGGGGCQYSITPTSNSVSAASGNGSVAVTATAGCTWSATSNHSWIQVTSGSSGTGNGTVNYTFDANTGAARSGTITIADITFTVNQAAGTPTTFAASGRTATSTNVGIPFATITFTRLSGTGAIPAAVQTDASGNWSQSGFDSASSYRATPSKPRFSFAPTSRDFSAASTALDFTGTKPADTIGIYRPSDLTFYLRNANSSGFADYYLTYGAPNDLPLVGDWDGDGDATIGIFRPSNNTFYLRNSNTLGIADLVIPYGAPGDVPIVGDWDGDGDVTIGVFRPSNQTFYLRNSNSLGIADLVIIYGAPGDLPVVGDWDGDGDWTIGIYRPSESFFYLRNSNTQGFHDLLVRYGAATLDTPVMGDWDGNGTMTVGVYRSSTATFYLRNANSDGFADLYIQYGAGTDKPLAGDWNGLP